MADRAQMRLNVFLPQIHTRDRRLGHKHEDHIATVRRVKQNLDSLLFAACLARKTDFLESARERGR
jgi:hypothetical protein